MGLFDFKQTITPVFDEVPQDESSIVREFCALTTLPEFTLDRIEVPIEHSLIIPTGFTYRDEKSGLFRFLPEFDPSELAFEATCFPFTTRESLTRYITEDLLIEWLRKMGRSFTITGESILRLIPKRWSNGILSGIPETPMDLASIKIQVL